MDGLHYFGESRMNEIIPEIKSTIESKTLINARLSNTCISWHSVHLAPTSSDHY